MERGVNPVCSETSWIRRSRDGTPSVALEESDWRASPRDTGLGACEGIAAILPNLAVYVKVRTCRLRLCRFGVTEVRGAIDATVHEPRRSNGCRQPARCRMALHQAGGRVRP